MNTNGQDQAAEQSSPVEALMSQFEGAFDGLETEQPDDANDAVLTDEPDKEATDSDDEPADTEGQDSDEEQPEAEDDADESDEDTEDSDESEDDDKEPALIEDDEALVEVDGERLTLKELKSQRMMQSDYTKKTQEVARQRDELQQQQDLYAANLQWLDGQAQQALRPFEGLDWEQLKTSDPAEYQAKAKQYQQVQGAIGQVKQQQDQFVQQVQEQRQQVLKEQAGESRKQLKALVPGWSNEVYGEIRKFASESLGFAADEFNQIADHRPIYAMYKAMLHEKGSKQSREKLTPKDRTVKSKQKAKASQFTSQNGRKANAQKQAAQRLRKSGSVDDAAAWFATQIDI